MFTHDVLGFTNGEGISWSSNPLYQDDEDDASPWTHQDCGHMEAPTTTSPTSYERYYQGNTGVDDENVPLADLRIHSIVACNMKCVACNDNIDACCVETNMMNNCSFPKFVHTYDNPLGMLCYKCYTKSPIACNNLDISFQCFACNDTYHAVHNEIAPIAFPIFGDFDKCHDKHVLMNNLHICHGYHNNLIDTNGDVHMKICIMMDDVFIYHAHTFFV